MEYGTSEKNDQTKLNVEFDQTLNFDQNPDIQWNLAYNLNKSIWT